MRDIAIRAKLFLSMDDSILNPKGYDVTEFDSEFIQPNDHKGQPQHEVKGGLICIGLRDAMDEHIHDWMYGNNVFRDGTLVFESPERITEKPLNMDFIRARCISYSKIIGANVGIYTKLIISAKTVTIHDIEHTNDYKRE